jgi:hypothetical protein
MKTQLDQMSDDFVTQAEFWPVKTIVYGLTALLLTGMVGAFIALVVVK